MEKLKKCRICLMEKVRMFVVVNKNLQELYEKLTDVEFVTDDSRPLLACFFCYAKLKQCYQLQRKCLQAEELFSQMLNEDYETKLLINQGLLEFFNGFVVTPTVHISISDECQAESDDIKEELPEICEGQDSNIEPKEEHQSELEYEYQEEYVDNYKYIPPHHSESDSEDDVPLMEFKTEVEEEQEVSKKKRTGNKTQRTPGAKKPRRSIRRPKLEDKITAQRKRTDQPDSKINCNTQKRTSKPAATKFEKPITNTKPIVNNCISKAIGKNCNNLDFTTKLGGNKGIQNDSMNEHRRLPVKEKPFKCDICQRGLSKKFYLKEHIRLHTGEKPFQCDICGRSFSHKQSLLYHIPLHKDKKRFHCDICPCSFSYRGSLRNHIRIHNGEKPYQCDICGHGFMRKNQFNRHARVHTGEKPYKCETCQRSFNEKNKLTNHIRQHTGEKPFKCDKCQDSFCVKSSLDRHIRLHAGEKPYKCEICQRSFSNVSDLKRHNFIHTGEKPFKCEICQKSFTQTSSLNVHRRTHTRKRKS